MLSVSHNTARQNHFLLFHKTLQDRGDTLGCLKLHPVGRATHGLKAS